MKIDQKMVWALAGLVAGYIVFRNSGKSTANVPGAVNKATTQADWWTYAGSWSAA